MTTTTVQSKLIGYLHDAHAMEQGVARMLDGMIAQTTDPEVVTQLRIHRQQTERQERLLRQRLEQLGSSPSTVQDVSAISGAWLKGLMDMMRSDKPGKNARDAYVTEHVEIAAYALMERLAERAGDLETTRLARFLGEEEREMAQWIENHWDKFVDMTLAEAGLESVWGPRPGQKPAAFGGHPGGHATTALPGRAMHALQSGANTAAHFTENHLLSILGCVAGLGVGACLLHYLTEPASRRSPGRPGY